MKKQILPLLLLLMSAACLRGQTGNTGEAAKVNTTITKLFDAVAVLDLNKVRSCGTKDFMLLENGAVWNMDSLVKKLSQLKAVGYNRVNHLRFMQTEVRGNTAWLAYSNNADITVDGKKLNPNWLESAFLVKEDGEWKIKLLHSSPANAPGR